MTLILATLREFFLFKRFVQGRKTLNFDTTVASDVARVPTAQKRA